MSFGFRTRSERISTAIAKAYHKNIPMFAAASNGGGNESRAFPASDRKVLCVHSTDDKGNRSKFSPTALKRTENFALPGENIKSSWPRTSDAPSGHEIKSGTSFATPVAVAIAANVLEYANQRLTAIPSNLRQMIRSDAGMRKIFTLMVKDGEHLRDTYDYVTPWRLFGPDKSDEYIHQQIKQALREL